MMTPLQCSFPSQLRLNAFQTHMRGLRQGPTQTSPGLSRHRTHLLRCSAALDDDEASVHVYPAYLRSQTSDVLCSSCRSSARYPLPTSAAHATTGMTVRTTRGNAGHKLLQVQVPQPVQRRKHWNITCTGPRQPRKLCLPHRPLRWVQVFSLPPPRQRPPQAHHQAGAIS